MFEKVNEVLSTMLCTSKIDMTISVALSDIDAFETKMALKFARSTMQYIKPFQAQQYLDRKCCLTSNTKLTGTK